mmetsp:Transcript_1805/g.2514  ORF Transcript_1805/g.2514 Transcript_1805/m.2514 type:complete len:157 (-) Transcript_1805:133-603(-)
MRLLLFTALLQLCYLFPSHGFFNPRFVSKRISSRKSDVNDIFSAVDSLATSIGKLDGTISLALGVFFCMQQDKKFEAALTALTATSKSLQQNIVSKNDLLSKDIKSVNDMLSSEINFLLKDLSMHIKATNDALSKDIKATNESINKLSQVVADFKE